MPRDIQRKSKKLMPFRWDGIVYFTLLGCIPAMLAAWALAIRQIHFKVRQGEYFHATPSDAPVFYWAYIALFCVLTVVLWGSTLYSVVQIIRSRFSSRSKKGAAHVA